MSPLRQWMRHGPREEHRLALMTGVVVVALVAWALVPTGHGARTAGSLPATPGLSGPSGGPADAPIQTTNPDGGGGASNTGEVGVAGGPHGAGPSPTTRRDQTGPTALAAGQEPLARGRAGCPTLRASDQGVTPTEIHVGVAEVDVSDPQVSGQFGFRTDTPSVVQALVASINERGGVACRKLVTKLYKVDIFNQEQQRAACTQATHDDHMFAFLDLGFLTTLAAQKCVTVDNHVPLVDATDWPASWAREQAPYYSASNTDANRAVRNWVFSAKRAGFFDPSRGFKKLGLLDCANDGGIADEIKRDLAVVGVTSIKEHTLDCQTNLVAAPSDITQAVIDHKNDGVSHVFPATLSTNVEVYLQAADAQGFHPKYGASDLYELSAPGTTEDFDPTDWKGTIAYTSSRSGELRNATPAPEALRCDAVLRTHGVQGIQTEWDDFPRAYCDVVHLFTATMTRVSANPTRLEFSRAVPTVGRLGFSGVSDGLYDRAGAFTGADYVRSIQWRVDPSCDRGDPRKNHHSTGCWFVLDPTFVPSS